MNSVTISVLPVPTIRVLLIAAGTAPDWQRGGVTYETAIEPDLANAADRLSAGPRSDRIDAVVLDARLSDQAETALHDLLAGYPGIAGIILTDEAVTCTHEPAWCTWIPASAPAALQAELLCLAVERARLRQAVGRSEARFRDVIERNADALVVMDRHGMILFANRMAVQLFRQPRHELIGSPFGFPVVAGETTELDMHANGHTRVVEMRVVESEWEGSAACIASLRDMTHRKQAEENARGLIREQTARSAAEAAARRFRFLADSSTVLSSSLDYHTTLTELAALCVTELADWAVVYIVDDVDHVRRLEVAHRDPSKHELACALRDSPVVLTDPHPVLDVLRTR
ncbi:MAG: PAS domain S-box protein, partial [Longimicrobiales bacterium]